MKLNDIGLMLNLIAGIVLTCVGIVALVVCRRKIAAYPHVQKFRLPVVCLGVCIGFIMSWVSWPIRHHLPPLANGSYVDVNFAGLPAPMAYVTHYDTRLGMPTGSIHAVLGMLAWPANMAFWCGVGQLGIYIYARRRARRRSA